eukprot:Em0086g5a
MRFCANVCAGPPADETTRTEATTGTCNDLQVQSNEVIKLRVCNYQNKDMSYTLQDMALQQIAQINALLTEADRVEMRKSFGLREDYNPLLYIPADLYLSILVEVLRTLLLDSCKHILKDVYAKDVTTPEEARVRAFNTSGFSTKQHGSVCYYYQSYVGRDFKGWTQMALFNLGPYLSDGQKEVLLAFSKVFRIAYCDFFKPVLLDEWKSVCQAFCGMQYDIVLGMFALTNKVLEHQSVVSQNTVLVSSGDYVELVISQCNMKYGILLATFKLSDGSVHCLV